MKVALCMSGAPRGEYEGLEFIKNMSQKYDCYLFLHYWDPKHFPNSESWSKKNAQDFDVKNIPIESDKIFYVKEEFLQHESVFKSIYEQIPAQYQWRKDLGPCSMFYGIKQASLLKEQFENIKELKFDCAFRMRFETKIKFITIENFNLSLLNIPAFDSYPINDQFAFSNSSMMSYYSNCYDHLVNLAQRDLYHPERMLNQHLKDQPINILHFGNEMSL